MKQNIHEKNNNYFQAQKCTAWKQLNTGCEMSFSASSSWAAWVELHNKGAVGSLLSWSLIWQVRINSGWFGNKVNKSQCIVQSVLIILSYTNVVQKIFSNPYHWKKNNLTGDVQTKTSGRQIRFFFLMPDKRQHLWFCQPKRDLFYCGLQDICDTTIPEMTQIQVIFETFSEPYSMINKYCV